MNLNPHQGMFNMVNDRRLTKYNSVIDHPDDEDNVYFDALIFNDTTEGLNAVFNKSQAKVLIDNPNDYYMTISRFQVPLFNIPIFKFVDGAYVISATFNNFSESQAVEFEINPFDPSYRDIFEYQTFVRYINTAFRNLMINLWNTSGGTLPVPDPTNLANPVPKLIFVNDKSPMYIRYPEEYNSEIVNPTVRLFFNYDLNRFFQNFPIIFNFTFTSPLNAELLVYNTGNNFEVISGPSPDAGTYYNMYQDGATFNLWWDIISIVVTTSLPITSETIATQVDDGSYNTINILTDVSTEGLGSVFSRGNITYIPQPQYRLVTLTGHEPIQNISFQFFYRTKDNTLTPINISPGTSITLKLLFIKRN